MFEKLFPDVIYDSIYDIEVLALKNKGIRGIIFDIDNTLVKPSERKPCGRLMGWLKALSADGFKLCVLSNANSRRVHTFADGLGVHAIHGAGKPSKKGFLRAMEALGLASGEVCMVGDQLFTDVFGAKRLGIYSVYTKPIVLFEVFTVMLKRMPEAAVFRLYYWSQGKQNRRSRV